MRRMALVTGALALGAAGIAAQGPEPIRDNYYAAGERVALPAPVAGDAVMAGRIVTIGYPVEGDVLAAGWRVTVAAAAADDVRAAGAEVQITSPVDGDLTAAGGEVIVAAGTRIGGRTWLSGGTVRMDGILEREVHVAANTVRIGGEVHAPLRVVAQSLEILPGAKVTGPVRYEGATAPVVAEGAAVTQPITYRNIDAAEARAAKWPRGISSVVFAVHVFIGGLLLLLVAPRFATRPALALTAAPGRSLLAGLMLVVTVPFVALLLIISVIGLPAGLVLAALYAAALFVAVVTTALFIGMAEERLLKRAPADNRAQRVAWLAAGVATLAILRLVPVLGTVVVFVAIVIGLGALGEIIRASWDIPRPAAAGAPNPA